MKCYNTKTLGIFILILFSILLLKISCKSENEKKFNAINSSEGVIFNEAEAKRYAQFAKMANCAKKPLMKNCKECISPSSDGYKMFFFYEFQKSKNLSYKFFIHYNDKLKKVVISFSAPAVSNHSYLQRIYLRGLTLYKLYNIRIEREFKYIYFKKLRNILLEKISKLLKSGRKAYKFIFTGYSLGASLAVLSAFDLTKSNVINRQINKTTVFTYGGLRIGDSSFITLINSTVTLWKIVKEGDYMVRVPNCYYSLVDRTWKCYTSSYIKKYIYTARFPLRSYYVRYIRPLYLNNVLLVRKNRSFVEKENNIKLAENKSNKKENLSKSKTDKNIKTEKSNKTDKNEKTEIVKENTSEKTNRNSQIRFTKSPQIVPRLSNVKTIYSYKYYYKYIYYTQPLGTEIYYNPTMTTYTVCKYISGISSCEKGVKMPATFSSDAHRTYYNIDFDKC